MNRLEHEGSVIAWQAFGPEEAPALFLWHSLGFDWSMWQPQIDHFRDTHRVIVADTPGHGASTPLEGPYTIERLCRAMLAVADELAVERFHLCGLSLGGLMALRAAIHQPERVSSLIACNTATRIGTREGWEQRIRDVRAGGMEAVVEHVVDGIWFVPGFRERRPEIYQNARRVFLSTPPEGYAGGCRVLADTDLTSDVSKIRARTLVVGGALDLPTPPAQVRQIAELIPNIELTILDEAAHLSNLDRPDAFNRRVEHFLSRSSG